VDEQLAQGSGGRRDRSPDHDVPPRPAGTPRKRVRRRARRNHRRPRRPAVVPRVRWLPRPRWAASTPPSTGRRRCPERSSLIRRRLGGRTRPLAPRAHVSASLASDAFVDEPPVPHGTRSGDVRRRNRDDVALRLPSDLANVATTSCATNWSPRRSSTGNLGVQVASSSTPSSRSSGHRERPAARRQMLLVPATAPPSSTARIRWNRTRDAVRTRVRVYGENVGTFAASSDLCQLVTAVERPATVRL
jgi:hypothetical protein